MAGLAQTYAKMGRIPEAEQLLKRVVEANPKDATSLQLAGELLLNSDPNRSLATSAEEPRQCSPPLTPIC